MSGVEKASGLVTNEEPISVLPRNPHHGSPVTWQKREGTEQSMLALCDPSPPLPCSSYVPPSFYLNVTTKAKRGKPSGLTGLQRGPRAEPPLPRNSLKDKCLTHCLGLQCPHLPARGSFHSSCPFLSASLTLLSQTCLPLPPTPPALICSRAPSPTEF